VEGKELVWTSIGNKRIAGRGVPASLDDVEFHWPEHDYLGGRSRELKQIKPPS